MEAEPRVTVPADATPAAEGDTRGRHFLHWRLGVALLALVPASAAAWSGKNVVAMMQGMATGGGGVGSMSMGLHESSRAMPFALAAAAALSLFGAAVLLWRPAQAAAAPGMMLPAAAVVLGSLPALPLWLAESMLLRVVGGDPAEVVSAAAVDATSRNLAALLIGTVLLGLLAIPFATASMLIAAARRRPSASSSSLRARGVLWLGAAVVFGVLAGAFYLRSRMLLDVAMRGSL